MKKSKRSKNPLDVGEVDVLPGAKTKTYTVPTCQVCGSLMFEKARTGGKQHDTLAECADALTASINASFEMFQHYNKHVAIFAEKVKWLVRDAEAAKKRRKLRRK